MIFARKTKGKSGWIFLGKKSWEIANFELGNPKRPVIVSHCMSLLLVVASQYYWSLLVIARHYYWSLQATIISHCKSLQDTIIGHCKSLLVIATHYY